MLCDADVHTRAFCKRYIYTPTQICLEAYLFDKRGKRVKSTLADSEVLWKNSFLFFFGLELLFQSVSRQRAADSDTQHIPSDLCSSEANEVDPSRGIRERGVHRTPHGSRAC